MSPARIGCSPNFMNTPIKLPQQKRHNLDVASLSMINLTEKQKLLLQMHSQNAELAAHQILTNENMNNNMNLHFQVPKDSFSIKLPASKRNSVNNLKAQNSLMKTSEHPPHSTYPKSSTRNHSMMAGTTSSNLAAFGTKDIILNSDDES